MVGSLVVFRVMSVLVMSVVTMMAVVAVMLVSMLCLKSLKVDVGGLSEVHERRHSLKVHQANWGSSVVVNLHLINYYKNINIFT